MNTDRITTLSGAAIAGLLALQETVKAYEGFEVNWMAVVVAVCIGVMGYYTNKHKK